MDIIVFNIFQIYQELMYPESPAKFWVFHWTIFQFLNLWNRVEWRFRFGRNLPKKFRFRIRFEWIVCQSSNHSCKPRGVALTEQTFCLKNKITIFKYNMSPVFLVFHTIAMCDWSQKCNWNKNYRSKLPFYYIRYPCFNKRASTTPFLFEATQCEQNIYWC